MPIISGVVSLSASSPLSGELGVLSVDETISEVTFRGVLNLGLFSQEGVGGSGFAGLLPLGSVSVEKRNDWEGLAVGSRRPGVLGLLGDPNMLNGPNTILSCFPSETDENTQALLLVPFSCSWREAVRNGL